jgi:hypothetical protein
MVATGNAFARAVGMQAAAQVRPELAEAPIELFGNHAP